MKRKIRRGYTYQIIDRALYERNKNEELLDMEVGVRAGNILHDNGIKGISDILGLKESYLMSLKNCHKVTVREIGEELLLIYGVAPLPTKKILNKCKHCGGPCRNLYCSIVCFYQYKKSHPKKQYERDTLIKKYRDEGKTLKQIGILVGISKQRVSQILLNVETRK